jgi:streptomycin 3"-adenylyltransferase
MSSDASADSALVAAVRDAVISTLGDDAVGAYLHGSTGLGRLWPRSDIDVLVVARQSMTRDQRLLMVDRLLDVSGRRARLRPGRPVELTVVVASDVRSWSYPPRCDFQYGEWLRDDYERGWLPSPAPSPDLALLLAMVLRCDAPVFGPPPAQVVAPVPAEDVVRGALAGVSALAEDLDDDTTNVLLTLARVWHSAVTGDIVPKDIAATWALNLLPQQHHNAMQHARAVYVGDVEEDWASLRTAARDSFEYLRRQLDDRGRTDAE